MKRSLTLEILEHLLICAPSLMVTALFVPYGTSLGRQLRDLEEEAARCPHDFSSYSREAVSSALSNMKQKGWVTSRGPKKKTIWAITKRGRAHFKTRKIGEKLPLEDGKIRLVIYDIPEKMASQRTWLRNRLTECDYRYLQKSVWVGTRPLPKELRDEFKERHLQSFIHVVGLEGLFDR